MTMQQFCLRWNNHQPNFISVFSSLLNSESLVDVTLAAEGRHLQAHKVVLSACSSYFQSLFTINPCQHPIVILKDVKFIDLKVMVDFMYYGEVNVSQEQLPHILKTAEMLKIKGLAEMPDSTSLTKSQSQQSQSSSIERTELLTPGDSNWSSDAQRRSLSPSPQLSPSSRRKRLRKSSTGSGSGSIERTSEEQHPTDILPSPSTLHLGSHIKPDPGFLSDGNSQLKTTIKQPSSDSESHRDSSQESTEGELAPQLNLPILQQKPDMLLSHDAETAAHLDMVGPTLASACSQLQLSGLQWAFMDNSFSRFALSSCKTPPPDEAFSVGADAVNACAALANSDGVSSPDACRSTCSSPINQPLTRSAAQSTINAQIVQQLAAVANTPVKRKRSVNPQAEDNFVRALEAVRFGGVGFCKAARMYGVNNRTLWLEYRKRGYPINRPSIKGRSKLSQVNETQIPVPKQEESVEEQPPELQQLNEQTLQELGDQRPEETASNVTADLQFASSRQPQIQRQTQTPSQPQPTQIQQVQQQQPQTLQTQQQQVIQTQQQQVILTQQQQTLQSQQQTLQQQQQTTIQPQTTIQAQPQQSQQTQQSILNTQPVICASSPHQVAMLGAAFPDFPSGLHRTRYQESVLSHVQPHLTLQGLNFSQ